uniref:Uncharacterized protein n=1 Tax=Siphoviridae sp. ctnMR5 TaxID=2825658 RepID=A0A8S5U8X1_9CAUD|nr:MAG TPA: hypothetical protein [Siphoviridae sp. ctnMR5]
MLEQYIVRFPDANNIAIAMAYKILQNNIICGDSLKIQEQWWENELN